MDLLFGLGFFFFMLTYFGNHGLGDGARVPIGDLKVVKQINGENTYIENEHGDQLGIRKFSVDNNHLYAETQKDYDAEHNDFVIWDLSTDKWNLYKTEEDYMQTGKVPHPNTFADFWSYYDQYWNGWRFWLLP